MFRRLSSKATLCRWPKAPKSNHPSFELSRRLAELPLSKEQHRLVRGRLFLGLSFIASFFVVMFTMPKTRQIGLAELSVERTRFEEGRLFRKVPTKATLSTAMHWYVLKAAKSITQCFLLFTVILFYLLFTRLQFVS